MAEKRETNSLKPPSRWAAKTFARMARRRIRKQFNALRLLKSPAPEIPPNRSAVVFLNHASWWDPLVCSFLSQHFWPDREHFAPIEKRALEKYGILKRFGFFPVEQSTSGARDFLRAADAIFDRTGGMIWITPQGEFADVRERPVTFRGGLDLLAKRSPDIACVPLAIEYTFWEERTPELLAAFGEPVSGDVSFEDSLADLQNEVAKASIARDATAFEMVIGGKAGVGGIYDAWRRMKAGLRGKTFDPRHADVTRPSSP